MKLLGSTFIISLLSILFIAFFVYACEKEEPQKGEISGRATISGTGIPVEGVKISLSGPREGSIITVENGEFDFKELPIGEYKISVVVPDGYLPVSPIRQRVRSNQISRVDILLVSKGSISGKISEEGTSNAIANVVIDITGGPQDHAESKTTDISGNYTFYGLQSGKYQLEARHPDFATAIKDVTINEGSDLTQDIVLGKSGPIMNILPSRLDFGKIENILSIDIQNKGREELEWGIVESRTELAPFPLSGKVSPGRSQPISFELDRNRLEDGETIYTVQVQSNHYSQSVEIRYEVDGNLIETCNSLNLYANFEVFFTDCKAPCEISVNNISQNSQTFLWEFGDGKTSTEVNPSHTYIKPGTYKVKLSAFNGECFTSVTKQVDVEWLTFVKTFGGFNLDTSTDILQTDGLEYVIVGQTFSQGNGEDDVYFLKLGSDGSLIREKTYGGLGRDAGNSISKTSDGGFIIAGSTNSFAAQSLDAYLVRTTKNGDLIWQENFGGLKLEVGSSVVECLDGGFLMVGYTNSFGAGDKDIYVLKTFSNGTLNWEKHYGGINDEFGHSVFQTLDGGFIIGGWSNSNDEADMYLLKISSNGDYEWEKTYGGMGIDYGQAAISTRDGGYAIVGRTTSKGKGKEDLLLIKTNITGDIEWEFHCGGNELDGGYSVDQTSDDGFIIAGRTESFGTGMDDVFLIKISKIGKLEWKKTFGGTTNDKGFSVTQTADGGFIVTGTTVRPGSGGTEVYLIKTDDQGNVQ